MKNILAIDIGTTAIKFDLFSKETHEIIFSSSSRVEMNGIEKLEQTQNPKKILETIKNEIKKISVNYEISQIVFSTAMHTLIPIDGEKAKMYLWSDMRASKEIADFKNNDTKKAKLFYQKTGTPIHGMTPFAKILHFKETKREWFKRVEKWIGLKDYLMFFFIGKYVTDYSNASATGLFNSENFVWDEEILNFLEINQEQLADLVDTNATFPISDAVVTELGLSNTVQITIGATDGVLASLASFIGTNSRVSVTIGTSGAVRYLSNTRQLAENQDTFCYYLAKDYWVLGGASNNGGKLLEWASELFYEDKFQIFNHIEESLKSSPIGAKGLVFLPHLNGERAPLWDETAKGSFEGVTLKHQRTDFIRSICEGILFNLKVISNSLSIENEDLVALSGGFFKIDVLVLETAAIFGKTCIQSDYNEPTFGAVFLCEPHQKEIKKKQLVLSDPEKQQQYKKSYTNFYQQLTR